MSGWTDKSEGRIIQPDAKERHCWNTDDEDEKK